MENRFEVRAADDGGYELMQVRPVAVARFESRRHAEIACQALNAAPGAEKPAAPSGRARFGEAPVLAPSPLQGAARREPQTGALCGSEPDWARGFAMIEQGASMAAAAAAIGAKWTTLRAKWAAACQRRRKLEQPAAERVQPAPPHGPEDEPSDEEVFEMAVCAAEEDGASARRIAHQYEVDFEELCAELRARRGGAAAA